MKKMTNFNRKNFFGYGALALVMALAISLFAEPLTMVSRAESAGKVTASSANVRKEANGSSNVVASVAKNNTVSIIKQVTAADGKVWYEVWVDANTKGYIRSDLVTITDGSTPPGGDAGTSEAPAEQPSVEIDPNYGVFSGSVKGAEAVRVRSAASTSGSIVATAQRGTQVTIVGEETGSDGKVWYKVNFVNNGANVAGYIRNDYVTKGDAITQPENPAPETPEEPEEPAEEPEVSTGKAYETAEREGVWYLQDLEAGLQYNIHDLFEVGDNNKKLYDEEHARLQKAVKQLNTQKIALIAMMVLLLVMAGLIVVMIFRIRALMQSEEAAYMERDEALRKVERRPQGEGARPAQRPAREEGARPQRPAREEGARPQRPAREEGARPQRPVREEGARPVQRPVREEGARPAGRSVREEGARSQRPVREEGARPVQRPVREEGARPAQRPVRDEEARPVQRPVREEGARPVQRPVREEGARPVQRPVRDEEARPVQRPARPAADPYAEERRPKQAPNWNANKYAPDDDDEFEYDFIDKNWDNE